MSGRPDGDAPRDVVFTFRMTAAEARLLDKATRRAGTTRSEFIRSVALEVAERVAPTADWRPPSARLRPRVPA